MRPQLFSESLGKQDGIRIHLDGEIKPVEPTVLLNRLPNVHKQLGVRCGAILRYAHRRRDETDSALRNVKCGAQGEVSTTKDGVLVATEDARIPGELRAH
jgi:hypothetical protein